MGFAHTLRQIDSLQGSRCLFSVSPQAWVSLFAGGTETPPERGSHLQTSVRKRAGSITHHAFSLFREDGGSSMITTKSLALAEI